MLERLPDMSWVPCQVFIHRLRKYLGAYLVHLHGKVDAIVFSAGLGENSALVREESLQHLEVTCLLRIKNA